MSKKFSKRNRKIFIGALSCFLLVGSVGVLAGVTNWNIFNSNQNEDTVIKEHGVNVKLLSSEINADGSTTKSFAFSIHPVAASNQSVTVTSKFKDGTDCSSYITTAIDNAAKTVSITTKPVNGSYGWSKPIVVTITSNANSKATADVTLEYVKKVNSLSLRGNYPVFFIGPGWVKENDADLSVINDFSYNTMVSPHYSSFTKDRSYTFKCKDVSVTHYEEMFDYEANEKVAVDRALALYFQTPIY